MRDMVDPEALEVFRRNHLETGGQDFLRTSECPEGLCNLKIVELQQLILANRLLAFTVYLFVTMLVMRRFMAIEHPACPDGPGDEWLPSIWRLYLIQGPCRV